MLLQEYNVQIEGIKLHYRMAGTGAPVLLLHGFPTSSFLYRHVAPHIAEHNQVIALDLPGFGQSDKPLDASYSFRFFNRILSQFLDHLNLPAVGLVVHDLGGPIGLHWACQNPQRVSQLAFLNTLVYPEFSWAVIAFTLALKTPGIRWWLTSPQGLKSTLYLGVHDKQQVTEEAIRGIQAPFVTSASREALIKTGIGLHMDGFKDIAKLLPSFKIPVRIIYGKHDRILPDVAQTMQRVARELPQAETTVLDAGHFLQEECPAEVGKLLAAFFAQG
jgi:pimeloyl-ACP methyl ester carboxylesterase